MNSPTPWYVHSVTGGIYDSNNNYVSPNGDDDSRRIVACVNACEGIPDDGLKGIVVPKILFDQLEAERDRLSRENERLRKALEKIAGGLGYGTAKEMASEARAVLAKAK